MAPPPALRAAPFPEDQMALVERLLRAASPEQMQWLSGYLAGFQAASGNQAIEAPAPAAPPVAPMPLTILYATESGNAEALALAARKAAQRLGFATKSRDMADATPADVAGSTSLLVIASTWGEGDPPQRAEAFCAALLGPAAPRFDGQRFAVLALGDRAYANFCATGRAIDARLAELGGERVTALVECDLDYAAPARNWADRVLAELVSCPRSSPPFSANGGDKQATENKRECLDSDRSLMIRNFGIGTLAPAAPESTPGSAPESAPGSAAVIRVDFARTPAEEAQAATRVTKAVITERVLLNSSRSTAETWHVELSLEGTGLSYEPGDAIGLAPRNDPALVAAVLTATGLADAAEPSVTLRDRYDITTLTVGQISAYAAQTGDATLAKLAADPARAADFLRGRQLIDLFAAAPAQLRAEQLIALLRPLPPRLYSVASAPEAVGEAAHLLVAAVRWESHGRARSGVASVDLIDRHQVGERHVGNQLSVHVKPNPHFRLPADPGRPIVMIGPGTGVAPFRAFLQRREAAGVTARAWLFFGARQFTHDFLYQLEWQDWLASGVLTRLDLAFSRDQPEKIYVQHRLWESRAELWRWLADGAVVYVCGDAKAMARDVHATLLRVIAEGTARDADGAAAWLRAAQQDGRYKRDVY